LRKHRVQCLHEHRSTLTRRLTPKDPNPYPDFFLSRVDEIQAYFEKLSSQQIVVIWRFTRNNAITEGFHTKMKVLQRQAYGFRNFQNYRLRVKVMCS
jgi:Transposase